MLQYLVQGNSRNFQGFPTKVIMPTRGVLLRSTRVMDHSAGGGGGGTLMASGRLVAHVAALALGGGHSARSGEDAHEDGRAVGVGAEVERATEGHVDGARHDPAPESSEAVGPMDAPDRVSE